MVSGRKLERNGLHCAVGVLGGSRTPGEWKSRL